MVHRIVFLRHGESVWNVENIFTGWEDVELSPTGEQEAVDAGKCLLQKGYKFDLVFTSVLERAVRTAWTACMHSKNFAMPIVNTWRLNERHYGALQGLNKAETAAKHGEEQVKIWRRSYDIPPPPISTTDPRHPCNSPLYAGIPKKALPGAESLALTVDRVLPMWNDHIAPCVMAGQNVLVAAHGNSLRALCKIIEDMSDKEVLELNIPTAVPLVYELDENLGFIKKYYLMDADFVAKKLAAVASQGKANIAKPMSVQEEKQWASLGVVLDKVYGTARRAHAISALRDVIKEHRELCSQMSAPATASVGNNDATLIVYANTFIDSTNKKIPLKCMSEFCSTYGATSTMKCIHMLPMFPWDTDRGFSVKDYYKVEPTYGDWSDIEYLASEPCGSPTIMFDYVCNHVSVENPWAQNGLLQHHLPSGHPQYDEVQRYQDFVICYCEPDGPADQQPPPEEVLAKLSRPRPNPVLTKYFVCDTKDGKAKAFLGTPEADGPPGMGKVYGTGYTWTTFSRGKKNGLEDTKQVDLNYRNPNVVAEVVRVLLFYVRKGSIIIRLDAIGYIWKVLGSASIHERGCHMLLAVIYKILHLADPRVLTVAEVNEPVRNCLKYLGSDELPESNMVYNFAPFPMSLHAQITCNVNEYSKWIQSLEEFRGRAFITTLGSHDGLAQKQVRDILPPEELERLQSALLEERGGKANFAKVPGGKQIVYEVCGTPWALVNGIDPNKEPFAVQLKRYINCLCLGLIPRGMAGLYAQGVVGAANYYPPEGLDENRTLNRESFDINKLWPLLDDPTSTEGAVFRAVQNIMRVRASLPQFDRTAPEPEILIELDPAVMAVSLAAPESTGVSPLLVLINVANEKRTAKVEGIPDELLNTTLVDVLEGAGGGLHHQQGLTTKREKVSGEQNRFAQDFVVDLVVDMEPFEVLWLMKKSERPQTAHR